MKITEYGITVVYLMILCRIAYADWKYQIIEPWTHIGILTLACMEMLFRVGVSVQERCLGAVVIAVPMLVLTVMLKGGFGGGDIKLMAVSGFLNGVKVITYAGMLGIILSGIYVNPTARYTRQTPPELKWAFSDWIWSNRSLRIADPILDASTSNVNSLQ